MSIGAWSAALPGGLAFFVLRWAFDAGVHEAIARLCLEAGTYDEALAPAALAVAIDGGRASAWLA